MNPKFLIGNTLNGSGKNISNLISRFGFDTKCCGNSIKIICDEVQKDRYDGIIFYVRKYSEDTFGLLKKIMDDNPQLKIYAISMIRSDAVKEELLSIGIQKCLDITSTPTEIYTAIVEDHIIANERIYVPEIIDYLYNKKIPYDLIGFNYLAVGIMKCIENPSITNSKMKTTQMYPAIAKACSTSYAAVERGLRKIAKIAMLNNINFNGTEDPSPNKLTAGKMVIAAAKEYNSIKKLSA